MSLTKSPAELERFGLQVDPIQALAGSPSSSSIASPTASSSRSFQSQHSTSSMSAHSSSTTGVSAIVSTAGRSPASTRLRYRHWLKPITPTPLDSDIETDDDEEAIATVARNQQRLREQQQQQQQSLPRTIDDHDKELPPSQHPSTPPVVAPVVTPMKKTPRPRFRRVGLSSLDVIRPRIYTRLLYFYENTHSQNGASKDKGKQKQGLPVEQAVKKPIENTTHSHLSSSASSPASSPGRRSRQKSAALHDQHHAADFMDPMLLQASLALVLSDFFPLVGRLVTPQDSHRHDSSSSDGDAIGGSGSPKRPYIECNDQGVLFVVADCSFTLDQIRRGGFQDKTLPRHLHPVGLYPATLRNPPILAIQLTYTQDGSVILGIAVDSMVMDGNSLASFMEAWSKTTQGRDYSPLPLFDRSHLARSEGSVPNATYRHHHVTHAPPPSIMFDNGLASVDPEAMVEESGSETEEDEQEDHVESTDGRQECEDGVIQKQDGEEPHLTKDTSTEMDDKNENDSGADKEEEKGDENKKSASIADKKNHHSTGKPNTKQQSSLIIPSLSEKYQIQQHQEMIDNDREDVLEATHELEGAQLWTLHFTPQQLDQIKKLASEQNIAAAACAADDKEINDKWVSTGDALVAYLWKLTTISRRMEPECKMMCSILMDVRRRLQPKITDGFIGNALLSILVQMPVHSLLTTPLSLPSRLIRDELLLQTSEQIQSAMSWIEQQEDPQQIETTSGNAFGQDFSVWSFRKLDLYSADFGQGPPRKVRMGRGGFGGGEGMCVMMDSGPPPLFFGSDGGITTKGGVGAPPSGVDVYLGLQGEHLQDFEKVHNEFMASLVPSSTGATSSSSARTVGEGAGWEFV